MENHIHLVTSADNLNKEMGNFKSYTARCIVDFLTNRKADNVLKQLGYYNLKHKIDRNYQVWQEGVYPQQIQNQEIMRQKQVKRDY